MTVGELITTTIDRIVHWSTRPLPHSRPAVFIRTSLRSALPNTARYLNPDSLTHPGTKIGSRSLGGLGLLLGTFGLAAVMLRNVMERQGEIAMLQAMGFTRFRIGRLIITENGVLLVWGIVLGTISALLSMLPHLLSSGADLPWQTLGITLFSVWMTGMLASVVPIIRARSVSLRDNLSAE